MSHVSYLRNLTPAKFNDTVERMAALIQDKFPTCNTIFGRGLSSAMLLPALAAKLNVEWVIVRKGEDTHSHYSAEASQWLVGARAVFVDDLIDSGASFKASLAAVRATLKNHAKFRTYPFRLTCLGAACYAGECSFLKGRKVYYMQGT